MGPISVLFICAAIALVGYWLVFHGFLSHDIGLRRSGLLAAMAAEAFAVVYILVALPLGWVAFAFIVVILTAIKVSQEMMREAFPAPKRRALPPEVSCHDDVLEPWQQDSINHA